MKRIISVFLSIALFGNFVFAQDIEQKNAAAVYRSVIEKLNYLYNNEDFKRKIKLASDGDWGNNKEELEQAIKENSVLLKKVKEASL